MEAFNDTKPVLVAKGYKQLRGFGYVDTFSSIAKLTKVRSLIVVGATQNWFLKQLTVDNAFLHGDLEKKKVI